MTGWDPNTNTYYINGDPTTLDQCGNGTWNGNYYIDGIQSQNGTGWSSCASVYFLTGTSTTLNSNGDGYWSGTYYIGGQSTSLDGCGNGFWSNYYYIDGVIDNDGLGYSACDSTYYITGTGTTLDSGGNGNWNNSYYIGGTQTSLDSCGNGSWNSNYYTDGVQTAYYGYGWSECAQIYYIYGNPTTLSSSGTGWDSYSNVYYVIYNNVPTVTSLPQSGTGWDGTLSIYYVSGQETTLDSCGNGTWNGDYYIDGVLSQTGTGYSSCASLYYIAGVSHSGLDQYGTGLSGTDGMQYYLGEIAVDFYYSSQSYYSWYDPAWYLDTSLMIPAASTPSGTCNAFVLTSISSTSPYGTPTVNNLVVSGAWLQVSVNVNQNATFTAGSQYGNVNDPTTLYASTVDFNGASYNSTAVTGICTFHDTSYNAGAVGTNLGNIVFKDDSYNDTTGTIDGNVTFKGRSYNKSGITGTVTEDHNRGINGSNILGLI